jgi:hypothetical protein
MTKLRDMREEVKQDPRPDLPGRDEEYIDLNGHLRVPVAKDSDRAPDREGWEAWWVNVNLDDPIQKVVTYRPVQKEKS